MIHKEFNIDNMTFSCIKYFQDFGFCIKYFTYSLYELLNLDEFLGYEYYLYIRIFFFLQRLKS